MTDSRSRITILGDGAWGTAMALVALGNGHAATLWGHDPAYLAVMRERRENRTFLPGVTLPEALVFEGDMRAAVAGADLVVVAIPTKFLRVSLANARGILPAGAVAVSLVKGIEQETLARPSEILAGCFGVAGVAVLSGPSHAEEVVRGLPATVTAAACDDADARCVQTLLMTPTLRIYTSVDVVGVELGGALKNVIAVAGGICTGLGLGDNALAALVTRGLAEITRLGVAMGADPLTFAGLSGMGDLVTTCVSPHGRNRAVGVALGQGKTLAEILAGMNAVAEGVTTAVSVRGLATRHKVEMPICDEVYRILYENKNPRQAVTDLMTREGKAE